MNPKNETILDVAGMSCASCASHIDKALRDVEGVSKVEVRLRAGKVMVQHDPSTASIDALVEALREAGYTSHAGTSP
ncbi:Hypothetical protein A7982_04049 [Minicystis rosea]|nr:Hypothetical protein A7982_04049 [Minicystis rosea]